MGLSAILARARMAKELKELSLIAKAGVVKATVGLMSAPVGVGPFPKFSETDFLERMKTPPFEYKGSANNIFKLKLDAWSLDTHALQEHPFFLAGFKIHWGFQPSAPLLIVPVAKMGELGGRSQKRTIMDPLPSPSNGLRLG